MNTKARTENGARRGRELQLPSWARQNENGVVVVDPEEAYPVILEALGVEQDQVDQYWLEAAYQIAKMKLMDLFENADPPPPRREIHIDSSGDRKENWKIKNFPEGRGIEAATQGKEARVHYQRIRDRIG